MAGSQSFFHSLNVSSSIYDTNANAYFVAANITNTTYKTAYNAFVLREKAASRYTFCKAFYPFLEGTATGNKYNSIDPRDLDAAYRLTFNGTITHSSNGIIGNGTTGYANTFFNPSTNSASGYLGIGVYLKTDINSTTVDMGAYNATGTKYTQIFSRFGDVFYGNVTTPNTDAHAASTSSLGWRMAFRPDVSFCNFQIDGFQPASPYAGAVTLTNANIYLLARNDDGTASLFSSRQQGCAGIWDGLSAAQVASLRTSVQTFMTDISR